MLKIQCQECDEAFENLEDASTHEDEVPHQYSVSYTLERY